jgi:hypothetical protein
LKKLKKVPRTTVLTRYAQTNFFVFGKVGFVSGFTSGGAYIKDIEDNYITIPGKSYKQVSFKHIKRVAHQNNWQFISHLVPYGA